ncbi:uncharacterized protein MELLADRAFT_94378 [Melampsora larici-populina 98AG31]|uniref:Uncharacterized protein n=1 Tax=Melampsora larici-populina (strain 98AG31 / pathotype 3-4-7) TaxID=747676 RepID=F4RBA3_MELLP|nr:uncharacterized protein MELLADRAFT_94378 [Melampsora larici-populina 98AG31]EGG10048.1 hypothetical protein MELLADRAFT_94378 [Melampsora larici-populina 98AG31]
MSEPSARGTLETFLDPSNPSVGKQTMLDWLRIHHPMTPIRSNIRTGEVAVIVREKQPEFFPDPTSDAPAVASGMINIYPTLEDLRVTSPITSRPLEKKEPLVIKRSASQDLEFSYPHKRIGIGMEAKPEPEVCGTSTSKISKKKKQPSSRTKAANSTSTVRQRSKKVVSNRMEGASISSPRISSILSLSNEDEKKELEGLKQSLFLPHINDQSGASRIPTSTNRSVAKVSPIKRENSPVNIFFNIDPNHSQGHQGWNTLNLQEQVTDVKASNPAHVSDDMDLINFSDTEVFEVGNLVIGRDIPAINMNQNLSPLNKKSGVDIFQEEQQRAEKVRNFEQQLAHLESSLEEMEKKASMNLFQDLQQQQANADAAAQNSSKLDEAMQKIVIPETKVDDLQVDAIDLQHELDIADTLIRGQARALSELLGPGKSLEHYYDVHSESDLAEQDDASPTNDTSISDLQI